LWNALGALPAPSRGQGRADRRRVRRVLRTSVDRLFFIDPPVARLARWLRRPYRWLTGLDLDFFFDSLYHRSISLGHPTDVGMRMAYWRKKAPAPAEPDPDRDRCGVIFCAPCVPFDGGHVRTVVGLADRVLTAHGFEPITTMIAITERFVEVIVYIIYDREVPGEDGRAMACHDELFRALAAGGYLPYRLGLQSMHLLPPTRDDSGRFLSSLKQALDPHRILAPGRYEFGNDAQSGSAGDEGAAR
jgi:4-cresol dehydrogenase (hydroxylating)